MGRTMDDRVQAARDRALLISQQDADAPRLTERLDAQSLAVLVEAFDAERAHSAEVERDREHWRGQLAEQLRMAEKRTAALAAAQAHSADLERRLAEAEAAVERYSGPSQGAERAAVLRAAASQARVAELERRLAEAEEARDEARTLAERRNEIAADERERRTETAADNVTLQLALAAREVDVALLREALVKAQPLVAGWRFIDGATQAEFMDTADSIAAALAATSQGGNEALREMLERAVGDARNDYKGRETDEQIVSRILGEGGGA